MKRARIAGVLCACFIAAAAAGCGSAGSEKTMEGMQLIQQMDYEGAHASFEAAAANGEDMQMICRGQGIAYMGQTDYANAVENLEMALTYSGPVPEDLDYDINYYLASAYYRNGQLSEALGVYEAITALRPQEKTAWYLKGTIELEQGATEAAKADFDKEKNIWRRSWRTNPCACRIMTREGCISILGITSRPGCRWKAQRIPAGRRRRPFWARLMRTWAIIIMRPASIALIWRRDSRTLLFTINSASAN